MSKSITVLGTGRMGSALVAAFLERGHVVTAWNRTASRATPLVARGARASTSVVDAVAGAEIVVGVVADYAASAALLRSADVAKALHGKVYVELASGTPKQAKEAAAWAREHGIAYLDGAIMATPNVIGKPGCTILYSGPRELFDAQLGVLRDLGDNAIYAGADAGHANALDNALLMGMWGALFGMFQGAAICEAEKLPLELLIDSYKGFMPVIQLAMMGGLDRARRRAFAATEATLASVDVCATSIRYIHEISKEHGIDAGVTEAIARLFERSHDRGHAQDDFASVYQSYR